MGGGYSKTTSRTVTNKDGSRTTYRTTRSRRGVAAYALGPYQSDEERKALWKLLGVLFVGGLVIGWPWMLHIASWAEITIAVSWYVFLVGSLLGAAVWSAKRDRRRRAARPR